MRAINRLIALLAVFALAAGTPAWAGFHGGPRVHVGFGLGYYGFGWGLGFGYYPYWGYSPYAGFYGYPYWGYYDASGAVRLQVRPKDARVLVDGYYTGIVDDFDGTFQRLRLPPGRHEITLKLPGFKTHRILLYAAIGNTLKIRYDLIPGTGEDEPDNLAPEPGGPGREGGPAAARVGREEPRVGPGEVRMNVRPEDAVVYVDGEFRGVGRQVRKLELAPGRHRIEVVRPGFRTFEREIDVEPGRTVDVDVLMERP
jgi:hypothetical protein